MTTQSERSLAINASLNRLYAAIDFKGAGASTKVANLLMSLNFYSVHDLQAVPWEEQPHVRGLERRLLAASGCGPVTLAQIKNIYFTGHVAGPHRSRSSGYWQVDPAPDAASGAEMVETVREEGPKPDGA